MLILYPTVFLIHAVSLQVVFRFFLDVKPVSQRSVWSLRAASSFGSAARTRLPWRSPRLVAYQTLALRIQRDEAAAATRAQRPNRRWARPRTSSIDIIRVVGRNDVGGGSVITAPSRHCPTLISKTADTDWICCICALIWLASIRSARGRSVAMATGPFSGRQKAFILALAGAERRDLWEIVFEIVLPLQFSNHKFKSLCRFLRILHGNEREIEVNALNL